MKKTVLLTGISGYIGLYCAKELLETGFKVRGTIRSRKKEATVLNTLALSKKNSKNLTFELLDLTSDTGWNRAVEGCDFIMHVASPFRIANPKKEIEMIGPAVDGTKRVLYAAQNAGVKRVIVTSSIVSMMASLRRGRFGPHNWTDVTYPNLNTYIKSKTLAEKAAWDWIRSQQKPENVDLNIPELVVIAPGAVFGPPLGRDISGESLCILTKMLNGKIPMVPDAAVPMIDVRDVAKLHVKAMLKPEASGKRFIAAGEDPISFSDVAEILLNAGHIGPSTKKAPGWLLKFMGYFDPEAKGLVALLGMNASADNSITREIFGWEPMPMDQAILESARSIKLLSNSD